MFGALGVSQDTPLANMYMSQRTLRLADGPDAVHRMVVGRHELKRYA
jgi:acyl-CoA dehydrogenase